MPFYHYSGDLGASITRLRNTLGWTQSQLSYKAEIPAAAISHFETGRRYPNFKNLLRLADAFDISLDKLVGRERVA